VIPRSPIQVVEAGPADRRDEAADVDAARSGDRAAFARLYERFAPMVHAVLLARVDRATGDDLVQDVFVRAMRRIGDLRNASAFGGWIAAIARNEAASHLRSRKQTAASAGEVGAGGSRAMEHAEAEEALAAIRQLPETYRETLLMRLVEGMTGPEIAVRTGMTPGSVRVNLCRGMALLRERLGAAAGRERT
jgi:RNA polymerase sigma-70 factor, ECF subfamily